MASTTRVAATQDALKTLLEADATLTGLQIDLGTPRTIRKEHVFIMGSVTNWSQRVQITGSSAAGSAREEQFTLRVAIVATNSDGYTDQRDRVIALVQAVEGVIRDNPTVTSTVRHADIVGVALIEELIDQQRQMTAEIEINCTADLVAV